MSDYVSHIDKVRAERDRYKRALDKLEWQWTSNTDTDRVYSCLFCGVGIADGVHKSDCAYRLALEGK